MIEQDPRYLKYYALNYWANYIETGDLTLSAKDAKKQGKEFNALSESQMETVLTLRELAKKELNHE